MAKVDLSGQWAIVTGASSGVGLEFCRCLASMGCNLLMVSNQEAELARYASEISAASGGVAQPLCLDLSKAESIDAVCAAAERMPQPPMVLINDAGIFNFCHVHDMPESRINLYIDLHMRATTLLCYRIGAMMAQAGRGYILNMSSMSCWMAMPGIAMYSSTKAYIHAFSRALRIELLESGVQLMVACPGGIATSLFGLSPRLRTLAVRLGVLVTPQKFAHRAIKRLLRGKAQYVNGLLNRISIVAIASLPEWARRLGNRKFLCHNDGR